MYLSVTTSREVIYIIIWCLVVLISGSYTNVSASGKDPSSVSELAENTNDTRPISNSRIVNETAVQNNNTFGNAIDSRPINNGSADESFALEEEFCDPTAQVANYCSGLPPLG